MKNQPRNQSSGGGGTKAANALSLKKNRRKNESRLGGKGGLSLESFANAKSGPSGYNPAIIKKQREFYKNAKYIKKYKKMLHQQSQTNGHLQLESSYGDDLKDASGGLNEGDDQLRSAAGPSHKGKGRKNKSSLQSAREEFERQREEEKRVRTEREAIIRARKEEKASSEAQRKSLREKMFKKTRSGQPLMKYRIEHLLQSIAPASPGKK